MLRSKEQMELNLKWLKNIEEESFSKEEAECLEQIEKKIGDTFFTIGTLGAYYFKKASISYLFYKDINSFRQYMYIGAKLDMLSYERRTYIAIYYYNLFKIMMSNNPEFINFTINHIDTIAREPKSRKYVKGESDIYLAAVCALALKGEWEDVIRMCDTYLQNPSKKPYFKYCYLEFGFYKALAQKDYEKMKELIEQMLVPRVARAMVKDHFGAFDFYLNIYAILCLKIALFHGIDLGIDCEMAPKELIDLTPATEYYEPYEFMKTFDLNTITAEEWKSWLYEIGGERNREELRRYEERGDFI